MALILGSVLCSYSVPLGVIETLARFHRDLIGISFLAVREHECERTATSAKMPVRAHAGRRDTGICQPRTQGGMWYNGEVLALPVREAHRQEEEKRGSRKKCEP